MWGWGGYSRPHASRFGWGDRGLEEPAKVLRGLLRGCKVDRVGLGYPFDTLSHRPAGSYLWG